MIRDYQEKDLDIVVDIWLEASIIAHSFIPKNYWEEKRKDMRDVYIPSAKTYVYEDDDSGNVLGFVSLVDNYIAALFVSPAYQGKGIGTKLINYVKQSHNCLILGVYVENNDSVLFYKKQGFTILEEKTEEHTGHKEYVMQFLR